MEPKSFSSIDDIPEAQRDGQPSRTPHPPLWSRRQRRWLLWLLVGLLSAIAGLVASWITYQNAEDIAVTPLESIVNNPSASPSVLVPVESVDTADTLLGHRAHEEAHAAELVSLSYDRSIKLRASAARHFEDMMAAAAAQGVALVPLSGFRSVADQHYLFFNIKAERAQDTTTRAEVSAPPGYSEHHTGYAIDMGDANFPDTHVQVSFETTPAFRWLQQNAARYNFELSFPRGNPQGIRYEPWHWRFVGDAHSLETFYRDR